MIKVKITKNVINKSTTPLGTAFTPRMIVCTILGLAAAGITIYMLFDKMNFDALMWIVFAELIIFIALGIKINGVSLFKLIFGKQKDTRPFNRKGVFNDDGSTF